MEKSMSEEVAEMVEAVINEHPQVEQSETPNQQEEPEQQDEESNVDYEQRVQDYEKRLKAADNLISKQKIQRRDYQERFKGYQEKIESMQKELETFKAPKAPKEDDYDSVMDFINAKIEYGTHQGKQPQSEQQLSPEQLEQQFRQKLYAEQRTESVVSQAQELSKKIPDAAMTFQSSADILEDLPDYVSQAIQDAENGALALYHLGKTGELESLASMSPTQAAYAVARAEVAGQKYLNKPTTQAPAPLRGAKGTASASPNALDMSEEAFIKKYL